MKHIDITFDLETAALCPTAAPLSIGAVVWDRNGETTPFLDTREFVTEFFTNIDMTSCFVEGLSIDTQTQEWWQKQSEQAKRALLAEPKSALKETTLAFFAWIEEVCKAVDAESVCLWSQGSDFDIAILRNICYVLDIDIPFRYTNFRDHRSVMMEMAARKLKDDAGACIPAKDPRMAYSLVDRYKEDGDRVSHTPVFDCKKSIFSTWQMMKLT